MIHPLANLVFNLFIIIITIWTLPWKIYAVWLSVKNNNKKWFIALLILNTMSILELIYIFKITGKKWIEVRNDFKNAWKSLK